MDEKDLRHIIKESIKTVLSESRPSNAFGLASKIGRMEGMKMLGLKGMSDGFVALYKDETDNVYEVEIRPAALIKDKEFWGNLLQSKEHPVKTAFRDLTSENNG